jgi:hypothetical protein
MRTIIDTYFAPNRTMHELRDLIKNGAGLDLLKDFSEAARQELRAQCGNRLRGPPPLIERREHATVVANINCPAYSGGIFSCPSQTMCRSISECLSARRFASSSDTDRSRFVRSHWRRRRHRGASCTEFRIGLLGPCSLRRLHHTLDRGVAIGAGELIPLSPSALRA